MRFLLAQHSITVTGSKMGSSYYNVYHRVRTRPFDMFYFLAFVFVLSLAFEFYHLVNCR